MHGKQTGTTQPWPRNNNTHVFPPQVTYPQMHMRGPQAQPRAPHYQQWPGSSSFQSNSGHALGPIGSILGPVPNQPTPTPYGPYGPRPHDSHGYWE